MKALAPLVLLALTGCAVLPRPDWSAEDTRRELAYQAVNVLDALQTAQIRHRDDVYEANPVTAAVIGREPSSRDVALYFTTLAVGHYVVSRVLPERWRKYWQLGTAGAATITVYRNCVDHDLLCD